MSMNQRETLHEKLRGKYLSNVFEQLNDECTMASNILPEPLTDGQQAAMEIIKKIQDSHLNRKASLADARRFQLALLYLIPDEALMRRSSSLVAEYNTLTDDKGDQKLITLINEATAKPKEVEASPAAAATEKTPMLRDALIQLVTQSNHILIARTERGRQRTQFSLFNIGLFTAAAVAMLFVGTAVQVFCAGVLGGVLSAQQRLISSEIPEDRWIRGFHSLLPRVTVWVSPIFGGVGALVLFAFLQSGLAQKIFTFDVFPEFAPASVGAHPLVSFLNAVPKDAANAALLVLLSFISGFSERLIPDLLDRLSGRLVNTEKAKT